MDLQEWVTENSERVQGLRDVAVVNYKECSAVRKENWDSKSKPREFQKGEQVLMRKSGMNLKLSESWLGPYTITKKNSPVSYKVDTGSRVIQSVHIQLLKQYMQSDENLLVKRVTMVLEPDTDSDSMDQRYAEVVLSGKEEDPNRESDIREWLEEF